MSAGIPQSDLVGLGNALITVVRNNAQPIETYKYQNYGVVNALKKAATPWEGGKSVTWAVRYDEDGSARSVGFHATDSVNIVDKTVTMAELMKFSDANFGFDKKELEMNKRGVVYRLLPERRTQSYESVYNYYQDRGLLGPLSPSDQELTCWGYLNWLCCGPAGSYTDGFNGSTGRYRNQTSGGGATNQFTTIGGQNRSTAGNGRLKNYTFIRPETVGEPFVKSIHRALTLTKFTPPPIGSGMEPHDGNFELWFPLEPFLALRSLIDSKNQNYGKDVSTVVNGTMYMFNNPISWMPALDPVDSSDTDFYRTIAKPIVGVRKDAWDWMHLPGRWMTETGAKPNPKNHDGVLYFIDSSGQLCPKDLRSCGFVGHLQLAAST